MGSARGEQIRKAFFERGEWREAYGGAGNRPGRDTTASPPGRQRKRLFRGGRERREGASGRSTDAGWVFPQRAVKLARHFQIAQIVAPKNLRVQQDKRGTQREGQAENERDGGQTAVGHQLPLPGSQHDFGTVLTGVEKVMLERPVLGEIIPAVILLLPTVVPELANLWAGE